MASMVPLLLSLLLFLQPAASFSCAGSLRHFSAAQSLRYSPSAAALRARHVQSVATLSMLSEPRKKLRKKGKKATKAKGAQATEVELTERQLAAFGPPQVRSLTYAEDGEGAASWYDRSSVSSWYDSGLRLSGEAVEAAAPAAPADQATEVTLTERQLAAFGPPQVRTLTFVDGDAPAPVAAPAPAAASSPASWYDRTSVSSWYDSGLRLSPAEPAAASKKADKEKAAAAAAKKAAEEAAAASKAEEAAAASKAKEAAAAAAAAKKAEEAAAAKKEKEAAAAAATAAKGAEEKKVAKAAKKEAPATGGPSNTDVLGTWMILGSEGDNHPKEITFAEDGSVGLMPFHGNGGKWSSTDDTVAFDFEENLYLAGDRFAGVWPRKCSAELKGGSMMVTLNSFWDETPDTFEMKKL